MPIVKNQLEPMRTTMREHVTTRSGIRIGSAYVPRLRADQAGWIDAPSTATRRPIDREDRIVLWAVAIVAVIAAAIRIWG
jgi:hypothetical protein